MVHKKYANIPESNQYYIKSNYKGYSFLVKETIGHMFLVVQGVTMNQ